jgi:hypothetical protein
METLDAFIERYHAALDQFVTGDPEPNKRLFSHSDETTLANPLGVIARGWEQVSPAMDRAASGLRDGEPASYEIIARHEGPELAFLMQTERFRARIGGAEEPSWVTLRTTSILTREGESWKVVLRHADPIGSPRPPESLIEP